MFLIITFYGRVTNDLMRIPDQVRSSSQFVPQQCHASPDSDTLQAMILTGLLSLGEHCAATKSIVCTSDPFQKIQTMVFDVSQSALDSPD